jgi:hypothetical protein
MNTQDPRMLYPYSKSVINEQLERYEIEREIRAAFPGRGTMYALRQQVGAILVRLGGWVHPTPETEPVQESALMRLAR